MTFLWLIHFNQPTIPLFIKRCSTVSLPLCHSHSTVLWISRTDFFKCFPSLSWQVFGMWSAVRTKMVLNGCENLFGTVCCCILHTHNNTLPPRSEQSALVPALREGLCLQPTYSRTTENRLLVDSWFTVRDNSCYLYSGGEDTSVKALQVHDGWHGMLVYVASVLYIPAHTWKHIHSDVGASSARGIKLWCQTNHLFTAQVFVFGLWTDMRLFAKWAGRLNSIFVINQLKTEFSYCCDKEFLQVGMCKIW